MGKKSKLKRLAKWGIGKEESLIIKGKINIIIKIN
jgi:hypothetical protein